MITLYLKRHNGGHQRHILFYNARRVINRQKPTENCFHFDLFYLLLLDYHAVSFIQRRQEVQTKCVLTYL